MKLTFVLATLLAAALAAPSPITNRITACPCEPVFCPLEIIAECRCKRSAAQACYEAALAEGVICEKPMIVSSKYFC
ncbi:hypothetical protein HBI04_052300 [Parastagonospora nodorum]|nr:hypothetical protein HBI04_052300 [Parastagonospora nodorum]